MPLRLPSESEAAALLDGFTLPEEFLFGTATAGYQSEGGYNVAGGPRNNWAEWETRRGNERTGLAARFWDDAEQHLDLARGMGLNTHRLTLEWARLQPVLERQFLSEPPPLDFSALDRYVDILLASRERGLEPVVTLHHFTHPYWAGIDLWLTDEGVQRFVTWVGELVEAVNTRLLVRGSRPIRHWITVNEPNGFAPGSYLGKWMPSSTPLDLRSPGRVFSALDSLYAAHVHAYNVIHRWYEANRHERPKVTLNNFSLDFYWADRVFIDLVLSRSRGVKWGPALRDDLASRAQEYGKIVAPLVAHSREIAKDRWLAAVGARTLGARFFRRDRFPRLRDALADSDWDRPLDLIALDYYDAMVGTQVQLAGGAYEPWDWAIHPEGLYDILRANAVDGMDILIAENGMAVRQSPGGKAAPRGDGVTRDEFIRAHVYQVLRAMKDGVKVSGYLHWSLTDNYEWGRYSPRFGLHAVDYSHHRRPLSPVDAAGVDAATVFGDISRALLSGNHAALAKALAG